MCELVKCVHAYACVSEFVCLCVVSVCACVLACVCACVRVCVRASMRGYCNLHVLCVLLHK